MAVMEQVPVVQESAPRRRSGRSLEKRRIRFAWCVLIPCIAVFLIMSVLPLELAVVLSFFEWNLVQTPTFVGFKNYVSVFTESSNLLMLGNTLLFGVANLVITFVFGFLTAAFFTAKIRGQSAFRVIWYIPSIISLSITAQLINTWIDGSTGVINTIISNLGGEKIVFTRSTGWMYFWILFVCAWRGMGSGALLFLAGMNGISRDVYEAADIDGVNRRQRFFRITIPCMSNMLAYILIVTVLGIFSFFEPVQLISNGGPNLSTRTLMFAIYDEAINNMNIGLATSICTIVLICGVTLTRLNFKFTGIDIGGKHAD